MFPALVVTVVHVTTTAVVIVVLVLPALVGVIAVAVETKVMALPLRPPRLRQKQHLPRHNCPTLLN